MLTYKHTLYVPIILPNKLYFNSKIIWDNIELEHNNIVVDFNLVAA